MKKNILIVAIIIIIISCSTKKKSMNHKNDIYDIKCLNKVSENELHVKYSSFGLSKEKGVLKHNDKLINKESKGYDYFYEIYKSKIVIISIKKTDLTGWAGISDISKDSIFFYDIDSGKKLYISLKKTYFARNKEELKNLYHYSENTIFDNSRYFYYAIDNVNINKNEIFLLQPNLVVKKYDLIDNEGNVPN